MTKRFPWKSCVAANGAGLAMIVGFFFVSSRGEAAVLAAITIVPINLLVLGLWASGRIRSDRALVWKPSRLRRFVVTCVILAYGVVALAIYYLLAGRIPRKRFAGDDGLLRHLCRGRGVGSLAEVI